MRAKSIAVTLASQVAIIWLNRPTVRNAIDEPMIRELDIALAKIDADSSVRAVVLAGHGPAFCAGIDPRPLKRQSKSSHSAKISCALAMVRLLARLDKLSKPTVARIHGAAYAGGIGLIAACDIAVSSMETEFCMSATRQGIASAAVDPYLVRSVGQGQTRRYLLSGEVFTAAEAYRIGLVHELAPLDELDARVNEVLGQLILAAPKAIADAKRNIALIAGDPVSRQLSSELAEQFAMISVSAKAEKGISAFTKRHQPAWTRQGKKRPPRKNR